MTSLLRISGLAQKRRFVSYHRLLNRAALSPHSPSWLLLSLLITAFVPVGPVVPRIDDIIKRRRAGGLSARGIYRNPVRSSHGQIVRVSCLQWLNLMLLILIPWAGRVLMFIIIEDEAGVAT